MGMTVGYLKEIINNLPNDMEIFVGCQGYSNFDFCKNNRWADSDTFAIVHKEKLFITDECAIEDGEGNVI